MYYALKYLFSTPCWYQQDMSFIKIPSLFSAFKLIGIYPLSLTHNALHSFER
jgi:hypothetical protein